MVRLTSFGRFAFASTLLVSGLACDRGAGENGDLGAESPNVVGDGPVADRSFRIDCRIEERLIREEEEGSIDESVSDREIGLDLDADASDLQSLGSVEGREFLFSFKSTQDTGDGVFVNLVERSPSKALHLRTQTTFRSADEPGSYAANLFYGFPSTTDAETTRAISASCTLRTN